MDIGALSMIMSQSRVQQSVGIAVMKMAMDTGKETATQMTVATEHVRFTSKLCKGPDPWEFITTMK